MQEQQIAPGDVSLASELVEQVCELPAVPTPGWATRAAALLGRIKAGCLTVCFIGQADSHGALCEIDSHGVYCDESTPSRIRERAESLAAFRAPTTWVLGDPALWRSQSCRKVVDLRVGGESEDHQDAFYWRAFARGEVLMVAASLHRTMPRRVVWAEIAPLGEAAEFTIAECAIASATVAILAHRARMAFGLHRGEGACMLTAREEQVLDLLTEGLSVKQIAAQLNRSPHTVHDHVKSLHAKLKASSRGELVARALGRVAPERANSMLELNSGAIASHVMAV